MCLLKWGATRGSEQVSDKFLNHPCSQNAPLKCRSPAPEFLAKFKRHREAGLKAKPWEGSGTSPDRTSTRAHPMEGQRPKNSLLSFFQSALRTAKHATYCPCRAFLRRTRSATFCLPWPGEMAGIWSGSGRKGDHGLASRLLFLSLPKSFRFEGSFDPFFAGTRVTKPVRVNE